MILETLSVGGIVGAIKWINSFGDTDIKHVKQETQELISDLSKSLMNLYDVVQKITDLSNRIPGISAKAFNSEFRSVQQYCNRFYFDQSQISAARTHCGDVERDVDRIKFKLAGFLRTDIGKWKEADEALKTIIGNDGLLLTEYDRNMTKLKSEMSAIDNLVKNRKYSQAQRSYKGLGDALDQVLPELKKGIDQMQAASDHIRRIVT